MKTTILEVIGLLGNADDESPMPEVPDVLSKFLETAAVAGTIGGRPGIGFAAVEAFREETAELNADVAARYRKIAEKVTEKKPVTPAGGDGDDTLEKYCSPEGRRKINLREYLKSMLAEGQTAEAVIAHAQKYDAGTANLLRELATEFA
jgi:hypothetical protein